MKKTLFYFAGLVAVISVIACTGQPKAETPKMTDISEFLGQWTIDIQGGGVGWLEVRQEDKYLDGDILWIGGSVLPVSNIFLAQGHVLVVQRSDNRVRKVDENQNPSRVQIITEWLEIVKNGDRIDGVLISPKADGTGADSSKFTGTKLPPVPPAPDLSKVKYGEPVTLFNGKDLTGWRLVDETQKNGFSVVDGILTNDPVQVEGQPHISYGNLRTEAKFEDFNLKLEVNVPADGNSGVYLRGMYEIQVADSYQKPLDSHYMGAVYSRIRPTVNAEKPAGTWQTMDITLCDRHATVILNGVRIIDNQPIYGPTGGAIQSDVFSAGPIYLQGDHRAVQYRNMVLTPIIK